jgi:hypothetical protein
MSNQFDGGNTQVNGGGTQAFSAIREPLQRGADQARETGKDIQNATVDIVGASAERIKKEASELVGVAKSVAAEAGDRLQGQVGRQKEAGAEYIGSFADTMRRAADEFETDTPFAATYIRKAADQVENVADAVRDGDFNDLVRGAQSFAQRQPTAFLGLTLLAGFGAVRFLKSSGQSGRSGSGTSDFRPASRADFGSAVRGS